MQALTEATLLAVRDMVATGAPRARLARSQAVPVVPEWQAMAVAARPV